MPIPILLVSNTLLRSDDVSGTVVSPDVDRCRQRTAVDVADCTNGGGSSAVADPRRPIDDSEAATVPSPISGYLSNHVTELTGCGNVDSPWRVRALPGQRINFTLFDFGDPTGGGLAGSSSAESSGVGTSGGGEAYVCQVSDSGTKYCAVA